MRIKWPLETLRSCVSARGGKPAPVGRGRPTFEESPKRKLSAPFHCLCGVTDVGSSRENNEDVFFVSTDGKLLIVADGMGGQARGELASALAVEAIVESMSGNPLIGDRSSKSVVTDRLHHAFATAQDRVLSRSIEDETCKGMGCALVAAYLECDIFYVCHVGDVRCYLLSKGGLEQLTQDHSVVGNMVRSGLLTSDEARFHHDKGLIQQAIGLPRGILPDLTSHDLKPGDRILLCSDGLWEALSDAEIASVLGSDGSMRQLASVLVDRATEHCGEDNITAVVFENTASVSVS